MDWEALALSLQLAGATVAVLLPPAVVAGRWLAFRATPATRVAEALIALPLVLPPTVLGFYLLTMLGAGSPVGQAFDALFGRSLVFTFEGLLLASVLCNIPFAVQPIQRAFEAIPCDVLDAADCCGLTRARRFARIELPLAWPGVLSAAVMSFAHTLGEFGVVLMVGGSIPGETRTVSIAIYDRMQAFDSDGAGLMSATLLLIALVAITVTYLTQARGTRPRA